jgi:hypothetical protein
MIIKPNIQWIGISEILQCWSHLPAGDTAPAAMVPSLGPELF